MKTRIKSRYRKYISTFSNMEKKNQVKFALFRTNIFRFILVLLAKLGLKPDHITIFSVISMFGFSYYYIVGEYISAFIFLIVNLIADGIDGSLARYLKLESAKGALTDIFADHLSMAIFTLTVIYKQTIEPTIGAAYLFLYFIMILETVILNLFNRNFDIVIRTKYTFYVLMFCNLFFGLDIQIVSISLIVFSAYMLVFNFVAFLRIRELISRKEANIP